MKRLAVFAFALLGIVGCAAETEEEESMGEGDVAASSEAAFTDSRSAVAVPWGGELWTTYAENRPNDAWPGVFNQPQMRNGPGSCGFAATANLTAQLLGGASITPWDVLDRVSYNTIYGIHPSKVTDTLNTVFRDRALVGDMQGTRFSVFHVGWRFGYGRDAALTRMQETLRANKPFIALVSYNGDGGWFNFRGNHYVVVAGMTEENVMIAHWGRYEIVPRDTFLTWWGAHSMWSFSGIVPDRASRVGEARSR